MKPGSSYIIDFSELGRGDVPSVGGKNASLGEMVRNLSKKGVNVPPDFATTAEAYWRFLDHNGLKEVIHKSEKTNDVQRQMLDAAARRPRDRSNLADRLRDGRF